MQFINKILITFNHKKSVGKPTDFFMFLLKFFNYY